MAIETRKDGRIIRTGRDYTNFRRDLYYKQSGKCGLCHCWTLLSSPIEARYAFHVHHRSTRGMGGSKRSDTLDECIGICKICHDEQHSKRAIP